ncbi:MAG: beta-phosphoglucomutase family hydrolase [Cryobacterium sp.]
MPLQTVLGRYDAVIFDLDGVVTNTAAVHAQAWKALFDEVLPTLPGGRREPFDPARDYLRYVDGRPRTDGIRTFLAARGIELPETMPEPDAETRTQPTVAGLAERKEELFLELLAARGVMAFPDAVALLVRLRQRGIPIGLVTSSRNSDHVLAAAGATELFDVRVDGRDARRLGLAGKPDPALFWEAARQLGAAPHRTVVIEDATVGVQAARDGCFGLVIGVNRTDQAAALRAAGADLILADLSGADLPPTSVPPRRAGFDRPVGVSADSTPWLLRFDHFDPESEGVREVLCALGNGYWGVRGAAPECDADDVHYPGTYLAGVYNRVRTELGHYSRDDEHMVNAPNWLSLRFRVAGGTWLQPDSAQLIGYRQELDLYRATLTRTLRFRDADGRTLRVITRRFVSQAEPHIAMLDTTFEAEDWSGVLTVSSGLDGRVQNRNVIADNLLNGTHLFSHRSVGLDEETILLETETTQSGVHISMAARTRIFRGDQALHPPRILRSLPAGRVAQEFELSLTPGAPVRVEKMVAVSTSRDRAIASPTTAVTTWLARLADPAELLAAHHQAWRTLWDEFGVRLHPGNQQELALNLNIFHVLQTVAAVDTDLDAGVPARGLHGEGYRGHVFWDEMFLYPILTLRRPDLTRAMLGYRYRRLREARAAAHAAGFDGAMFPWQSGIDGQEATPTELLNTRTDTWIPDNSHRQRHVGLAIAYSVWQYYQSTGDSDFLIREGAEMVIEVARFFASLARHDAAADRYDIIGVMGPDEFHDGPPGHPGAGLRNNSYTNICAAWVLTRAAETVTRLEKRYCRPLWDRVRLRPGEVEHWDRIRRRLRVCFHTDGVLSQFEGYEDLPEFDWDGYRERYRDLGRLDLILNAEGDTTNNYRLSKQADVLMLLYLFSAEELRALLHDMGYAFPPAAVVRTVEFYGARSTHGSTLSSVVHSWVEARRDRARSWTFLTEALDCDLGGATVRSTREGIHLGAMAGSIDMLVRCYTGLEIRDDRLWLHPALPAELAEVSVMIHYREQPIRLVLTHHTLRLELLPGGATPTLVRVEGQDVTLVPGQSWQMRLGPAANSPAPESPAPDSQAPESQARYSKASGGGQEQARLRSP